MDERRTLVYPLAYVPTPYPVIFVDDCNGTFRYVISGTGADYIAAYSTAYAYSGAKGMQFRTRTTTPAIGDIVTIGKYMPLPVSQLCRLRLLNQKTWGGDVFTLAVILYFYNGTTTYAAELLLDTRDSKVYYAATIRANYTDTGLTWCPSAATWNLLDFSFNVRTGYWHKCRVNGQTLNMSAIPLASAAAVNPGRLVLIIELTALAGAASEIALAHILITEENP